MSKNSKESGKNTKKIRVVSKRDLSNQQQTIGKSNSMISLKGSSLKRTHETKDAIQKSHVLEMIRRKHIENNQRNNANLFSNTFKSYVSLFKNDENKINLNKKSRNSLPKERISYNLNKTNQTKLTELSSNKHIMNQDLIENLKMPSYHFGKTRNSVHLEDKSRNLSDIGSNNFGYKEGIYKKFHNTIARQTSTGIGAMDPTESRKAKQNQSNFSTMLTPKCDESIVKDIKSTERIKLQKYYSQIETHERMFKIKEDVFLKKIEQDLLEEYEFYIKKK